MPATPWMRFPAANMVRLLFLLPLLLLSSACATLKGKADELARRGRFVEAAAIYDDLVQQKPNDTELLATRDNLRWSALEQLLGKARRHRVEGRDEQAENELLSFLTHRAQWDSRLNGALESSLLEEMAGTHQHCRQIIGGPAKQGLALTAEGVLLRKRPLLAHPELAVIRREMETVVLQSGKDACERLKTVPSEGTRHWQELVFRYCRHWQEEALPAQPGPELMSMPTWSGEVEGLTQGQQELLRSQLARAFESSPWYSPEGERQEEFSLQGRFSSLRDSESVWRTAPWTDSEPYTDHEERTETIEEPYEDEEEYTDSDGKKKTRKVTRTRKRTRSYTVPVTRYRDVHKTYAYRALRLTESHRLSVASSGVLDPRRGPLRVVQENEISQSGYEHDVTFYPGNVHPERATFTPSHAWLEGQLGQMGRSFGARLTEHWRESFCSAPALTLDEAARCARAGGPLPEPARRVLAEVLGEDVSRVTSLFGSP